MFARVVIKLNRLSDYQKKGYPQELVIKTIQLHLKSLDRIKTIGPEKCTITLKVPLINKSSEILEKKTKH